MACILLFNISKLNYIKAYEMDNLSVDNFNENTIYNYFNQETRSEVDSVLEDKLKFVPSRLLGQMHYLAERKGDKLAAKNIKKLCKKRGDLGAITKQHISCFFKYAMKKADSLDMNTVCNTKYLEVRKELLKLVPEAIQLLKGEEYRELEGLDLVFYTLVNKPKVSEQDCYRLECLLDKIDQFTAYFTINQVAKDRIKDLGVKPSLGLNSELLNDYMNPLAHYYRNVQTQNTQLRDDTYTILIDNSKELYKEISRNSNIKLDDLLSRTQVESLIENINTDIKSELQSKTYLRRDSESIYNSYKLHSRPFLWRYIERARHQVNNLSRSISREADVVSGGNQVNSNYFLNEFKLQFCDPITADKVQLIKENAAKIHLNLENINIEHPQVDILKSKINVILEKDIFTKYDMKDVLALSKVVHQLELLVKQNEFYSERLDGFNKNFDLMRPLPSVNDILDHVDFSNPKTNFRDKSLDYTYDLSSFIVRQKRKLASTCYILQKTFESDPMGLEAFQEKTNKDFRNCISNSNLEAIPRYLTKLFPNELINWEGDMFKYSWF